MKQNKIKCKEKFYHILWIKMKKKELKEELQSVEKLSLNLLKKDSP